MRSASWQQVSPLPTVMSTRRQTRSSHQSGSDNTMSTASRGRGKRGRGGSTISAPPGKRSRNDGSSERGRDSLTRDDIPTIVQAVLDVLLTGATRGTNSTTESSNQDAAVTNDSSPDNQDLQQESSE